MSHQIDQSGKIEQTNKPTVLAIANSRNLTVKISATEKQKLVRALTQLYLPHKTYVYQIFAVLVYILLVEQNPADVTIDMEYAGHNQSVKEILIQLFDKSSRKVPSINFGLVTKKSLAHELALNTYQNKLRPNIVIDAFTIIKILTTKKGGRPRSSRGSP